MVAGDRIGSSGTQEPSPYSSENVRKGVLHYLLGRGVAGVAGFATVLLLVRYMDVQSYAGYTALSGLTMMCGIVASLGLERAIARYVPEGRMQRNVNELASLIWKTALCRLVTSATIALLLFAFWGQITEILDYIGLDKFPLPLAAFIVAETLFLHFSSVLQSLMMQKTLTRLFAIQWFGRLLLIALAVAIHARITLEESFWIFAIPEAFGVLAFVVVLRNYLRKLPASQSSPSTEESAVWPPWRAVSGMAMHNYGFSLLAAPPQGYFMRMLIAVTLPVEVVAAYGFFQSLAEKARQYIPMNFFYNMVEPLMMARYLKDGDFGLLIHRCQVLYKTNLLLLVPAIVWIAVAGPYISTALTGGKFADQSWILLVVMIQLILGSHVVVLQLVLNALGQSELLLKASSYALFGFVSFVLIAIQVAGVGILFAPMAFSLIVNSLVVANLNSRGHSYRPAWKMLRGMTILGFVLGVAAAFVLSMIQPTARALVVACASGFAVFMAFGIGIYAFSVIDNEDIDLVRILIGIKKDGQLQ